MSEVLSNLPEDLPAAITVVQHLDPQRRSLLVNILETRTKLRVKQAEEGDKLQPGTVYIAPPNQHLLISEHKSINLSNSQLVHFVRPSADLMFESVAASFKQRAIAVALSGLGIDGSQGVQAIKQMGGKVLVQEQAAFAGMPTAAINIGSVDQVLPLAEIAPTLINLLTAGNAY